jgi:hypothetical protein
MPCIHPVLCISALPPHAEVQYDQVAGNLGSLNSLGDPNAKPRAPVGKAGGGKPEKDERSWLQKNWMFVAAGERAWGRAHAA